MKEASSTENEVTVKKKSEDYDIFIHSINSSGIVINSIQLNKLKTYHKLLLKWQKSINLVAYSTLNNFWTRHVLDSLQLIPYLKGNSLLDIGSGGGFPGMILAIVSDFNIICLDSDNRKIQFLSEVARITDTKINLINKRAEIFSKNYKVDTVCSRGFADLKTLLHYTSKCSSFNYGLFLKGRTIKDEIELAKRFFDFRYNLYQSKVIEDSWIITVEHITSKKFTTE